MPAVAIDNSATLCLPVFWKMYLTFHLTTVEGHDRETIFDSLFFQTWIIQVSIKQCEIS